MQDLLSLKSTETWGNLLPLFLRYCGSSEISSAALAVMRCLSVCVSLSVCPSRLWFLSKRIIVSSNFFHRRIATLFQFFIPNSMAIFRQEPFNGGVECRWGRQKLLFWANIWLHCVLWSVPAASAATNHGEFITLVTGKRPSLLMVGNNGEVYDKKPQCYAEDNVTQW